MNKNLRDEFAMAAMNSLIHKYGDQYGFTYQEIDSIKNTAFAIADAMLVERAKTHPGETPAPSGKLEELTRALQDIADLNPSVRYTAGAAVDIAKAALYAATAPEARDVLPEKFSIEITIDNYKDIDENRDGRLPSSYGMIGKFYAKSGKSRGIRDTPMPGSPLITTDQFRRLVAKQP